VIIFIAIAGFFKKLFGKKDRNKTIE